MDKYEYKVRSEEIKRLIGDGDYVQAAEIADTIDWRRVKSIMMLCTVSDLYKVNRRYEDAKNMLLLAYERRQGGRTICYSLCELCIKTEDFVQAVNYYKEFVQAAPKDSGRYILQYKIYEAQDVSLEERIGVLEELKKRDYREKWAYELAYLYHRVGLATRCVEECDELILWFGEGKYVVKAMELKMLHQALTPAQQEAYDHRYDRQEQEQAEEYADAQGEESFSGEEVYGEENQDMPPETEEYYETSGLWQEDEEQAAGEEYPEETPEELDIQVKTMDVGQFNTINLQEELAAGLQEVLGAEEVRRGIPEPEGRETALSPSPEDGPTAEEPDTEDEEVEVFFGETGEIGDVPLEDLRETPGREAEEQMSSLRTGTPYPARFAQGSVQENAKSTEFESEESEPSGAEEAEAEWEESGRNGAQGTGAESEGLERTEARRTGAESKELERNGVQGTGAEWEESGQNGAQGTGAESEGLERNEARRTGVEPGELERNGVQGTGAEWEESGRNGAKGTGAESGELERNGAKGTGVEPEESVGRETSGPAAGNRRERSVRKAEERQGSTEDTGLLVMEQMRREAENGKELNSTVQSQPPKEMAGVLSQEANGQIRLVMPDNVALEKQITGQMNIQDILSEWERMKKENQEKCREEVRQHVLQQTGPMFTEFEAAVRDGLLEQLETGRVTNAQLQEKAQARGESVTGRAGTLEDPENSEKAFKDALDGRETGGIEEEWIPEKGEEIDEFLASDGCWEGEGAEDLETEGEAYEEQAGYFEDAEAFEGEIEELEEVEILEEESEDPEDTEAFEEEMEGLEDAEAFEEEMEGLEKDAGAFEEDAEDLEEDAEDLEEDAGAFEEDAEDLEEDAGAFEEDAEDLEEDAGAFEEDAEDLEEDAGAFEEDAEDLEDAAGAFGEDAEDLEEDAGAFEEDAEDLEEDAGAFGEDEEDLEEDAGAFGEDAADEGTAKDSGKADRGKRTPAKSRGGKNAAASKGEKDGPQRQPIERDRAKVRALTREEKELYAPFIQSRRSREQLVKAIDNVSMAAYTGNIVITGEEGMDTLSLAKNMIREVQIADSNFSGQVAKISGQGLNQRNVRKTLEEMNGGALIIYKASGMTVDTARNLYRSLQQERLGIIVVLEDTKKAMQKMFLGTPELVGAFTARFDMEALSNDMLVLFGKRYAREMEFSIDELGVLALHTRIEELQTIDHVVTVVDVKKIVDEAIHHASRKTLGHFFDVLFARRYDEEDMIILTEKDFVA